MISKIERDILKNAIGPDHYTKIFTYLKSKGYVNTKGQPYTKSHIRNVFNGHSHETLEALILEAAEYCKSEREKLKKLKSERLKKLQA